MSSWYEDHVARVGRYRRKAWSIMACYCISPCPAANAGVGRAVGQMLRRQAWLIAANAGKGVAWKLGRSEGSQSAVGEHQRLGAVSLWNEDLARKLSKSLTHFKVKVGSSNRWRQRKKPAPICPTHPVGKGLVWVRIFQTAPAPIMTHTCDLHRSHNPWLLLPRVHMTQKCLLAWSMLHEIECMMRSTSIGPTVAAELTVGVVNTLVLYMQVGIVW